MSEDVPNNNGPLVNYAVSREYDSSCGVKDGTSEAEMQHPSESNSNNIPLNPGKSNELISFLPKPISLSTFPSCTDSSQSFVPQFANMMECHELNEGEFSRVVLGREDAHMLQDDISYEMRFLQEEDGVSDGEDDVDELIDRMRFTISDGDGNAEKLSNFLTIKGRKGIMTRNLQGRKGN